MAKQIRVHNQGKRAIDYPRKNKKPGMIEPGRAVTMDEKTALKYLKAYPRELIEFDSLVVGGKKNINKENSRLESENKTLNDKIVELEKGFENTKKAFLDLDGKICTIEDKNIDVFKVVNTSLKGSDFKDVNLSSSIFENVNLSKVLIENSNIEGMKINGNLISDLENALKENQANKDKISELEKELEEATKPKEEIPVSAESDKKKADKTKKE